MGYLARRRKYSLAYKRELERYSSDGRRRLLSLFWLLSSLFLCLLIVILIPFTLKEIHQIKVTLTELLFPEQDIVLYCGDEYLCSPELVPSTAETELNWTLFGDLAATVDSSGLVRGLRRGEAVLSVNARTGVSLSIPVTVVEKPLPPGSDLPQNYSDTILIANVSNPLSSTYIPELTEFPKKYHTSIPHMKLTPETFSAFERMYADALAATGQEIYILSAYRSYDRQVELFEEDVRAYIAQGYSESDARKYTGLSTQLPGCSEHQLGNSLDIGSDFSIDYKFYETRVGAWVTAHAHEYGFILRYPAGKTHDTGISDEAWHFRYVGTKHAGYIFGHGLCLEEYIELQNEARQAVEEYSSGISARDYLALTQNGGD